MRMIVRLRAALMARARPGLWRDGTIIRADLFGPERLEHHAVSLAQAQTVTPQRLRVQSLSGRVQDNAAVLLAAYLSCAQSVQGGSTISPAAEWLLDNFHLVELQLQQIKDDLPPGYYRQLPKLATGPFAGYPRVLGIAWAYVAHTDSLLNGPVLARFVRAYQTVQPLTIGELWALAITLRIVLVENLRRLADQIIAGHEQRQIADTLVDSLATSAQPSHPPAGAGPSATVRLARIVAPLDDAPLPLIVAAQIAKRLRGCDPAETPLCDWLDDRLAAQGLTRDDAILHAQQRQGASNVTMRNVITSMRMLSDMDWQDFFEEVSLIDARLREGSDFAALDFATRNMYRTAIETLARRAPLTEAQVTEAALALAMDGDSERTRDPGHVLIGAGRGALEARIGHAPGIRLGARRLIARLGLPGYLAFVGLTGAGILGLALWAAGATGGAVPVLAGVALALAALALAFEAGMALVNLVVTRSVAPRRLPGLELARGVPPELRCLVAVPILLTSAREMADSIDQL
ncbi:MAG: glycosyl transferase, partial [Pararhodobacter sp.]|nr:glycosyl transferase [Pararhodobacter sp.]